MSETLFRPSAVADVLRELPTIAAAVDPPEKEGQPSIAFPHLRKSRRQIYRALANTHVPHVLPDLRLFERTHAAGCSFGRLLATRSRHEFQSLTSDVLVAEDLLERGYYVQTVLQTGAIAPDLHVTGHGIDLAIEIYRPREWDDINTWRENLHDLLKNVDASGDFNAAVHTRLVATAPVPLVDPWELAQALRADRENVLAAISRDLHAALASGSPLAATYEHEGTDLETVVELDAVRRSDPAGPSRTVFSSSPGYGGYSPAGVFARVVDRAKAKARRGQAQASPAETRALLVDLMGTQIADDLAHPAHRAAGEKVLHDIDPTAFGLDLFAYCVRAQPRGVAALYSVYENTKLTGAQVKSLFGSRRGPMRR